MIDVPNEKHRTIVSRLSRLEADHGIEILFAVESGSRAWGFESADSDYDIRFVYRRPISWYLSVQNGRPDTITLPLEGDLDMSGWDVSKATRLFWGSNPSFMEWISSPILYMESGPYLRSAKDLVQSVWSPLAGWNHYRSMAKSTWMTGNNKSDQTMSTKKILYALRATMAADFIERYMRPPAVEFSKLRSYTPMSISMSHDIDMILDVKRSGLERDGVSCPPRARQWIESVVSKQTPEHLMPARASWDAADDLFRGAVTERLS